MSCNVLSLTNQKGGVGKTSSTLNLGAALNIEGKQVLLIDNDPQGNLTTALGYTPGEQSRTLANLLLAAIDYPEDLELHLQRAILHMDNGLDLIPANRRLADAAARLQVMQLSQYNAVGDVERASEKITASLLELLRQHYDYIIIDCGLKHELLTVNALAASDYCIIPVQAHFLASEDIPDVLELVKSVQSKFNPELKIAGILLTMEGDTVRCDDGTDYYILGAYGYPDCGPIPSTPQGWPWAELPEGEAIRYKDGSGDYLFMQNIYETLRLAYTVCGGEGIAGPLHIRLTVPEDISSDIFFLWDPKRVSAQADGGGGGIICVEAWDMFKDGVYYKTVYEIGVDRGKAEHE